MFALYGLIRLKECVIVQFLAADEIPATQNSRSVCTTVMQRCEKSENPVFLALAVKRAAGKIDAASGHCFIATR